MPNHEAQNIRGPLCTYMHLDSHCEHNNVVILQAFSVPGTNMPLQVSDTNAQDQASFQPIGDIRGCLSTGQKVNILVIPNHCLARWVHSITGLDYQQVNLNPVYIIPLSCDCSRNLFPIPYLEMLSSFRSQPNCCSS